MRRLLLLILPALLALGVAQASASSPYDGQTAARGASLGDTLLTLPFALGEVDLATIGVSADELVGVGLSGATVYSAGDGPNMRIVDDDRAECPNAAYTSIQAAVTASDAGDQIKVCPGLYQEQITIPADKDNLTLFSRNPLEAVIRAPLVMVDPGDIIHVDGAQDVAIRQFTIRGPLPDTLFCSLFVRTGIRVDGNGSATVYGNHITEIRSTNPALRGCQNGIAVMAGRRFEGEVGSIELSHNLIDEYQKGGVFIDNAGSYGHVDHNEIVGTPTPVIAPNGVQISRDAAADVDHNVVRLNQYSLASSNGTAILLFQPGAGLVNVDHNEVVRNDDGISLYDTVASEVDHNYSHNQTKFDGIYADPGSRGNVIAENKAFDNFEHDCHDDSVGSGTGGTANYWLHDMGRTQNRPGLCKNATTT